MASFIDGFSSFEDNGRDSSGDDALLRRIRRPRPVVSVREVKKKKEREGKRRDRCHLQPLWPSLSLLLAVVAAHRHLAPLSLSLPLVVASFLSYRCCRERKEQKRPMSSHLSQCSLASVLSLLQREKGTEEIFVVAPLVDVVFGNRPLLFVFNAVSKGR
ncbi:hypothetical protein LWI28_028947 [Acer negundo]|uniref:Uncharacterized protein n=1 Tax=Acer negundo TaxID=4023 RepID=A0AAD5IT07_ACENE|nr:hypothetical protein LWI28_028947 [Acer negundo]